MQCLQQAMGQKRQFAHAYESQTSRGRGVKSKAPSFEHGEGAMSDFGEFGLVRDPAQMRLFGSDHIFDFNFRSCFDSNVSMSFIPRFATYRRSAPAPVSGVSCLVVIDCENNDLG